ncbi:hypothetical protein [Pseudomonas phage PMBT54]|nr:hypothetical protein [Pseudomonas phage PMBT54]
MTGQTEGKPVGFPKGWNKQARPRLRTDRQDNRARQALRSPRSGNSLELRKVRFDKNFAVLNASGTGCLILASRLNLRHLGGEELNCLWMEKAGNLDICTEAPPRLRRTGFHGGTGFVLTGQFDGCDDCLAHRGILSRVSRDRG